MDTKTCTKCLEDKAIDQYYFNNSTGYYASRCRVCTNEYVKAYAARNKAKYDPSKTPETKECGTCYTVKSKSEFAVSKKAKDGLQYQCLDCHRDKRYGLKPGQYDRLLSDQDGKCAICQESCKQERSLSVDHNHNCCPGHKSCGDCVRGLLCQRCNAGIGLFRDSEFLLKEAINYLSG